MCLLVGLSGLGATASGSVAEPPAAAPTTTAVGHGDDYVLTTRGGTSPLAGARREAREADRRGAPVIHHVHASVVAVTTTTADDARTVADLSREKVAAAVAQLDAYYREESGGRVGFDLVGYEVLSWDQTTCDRSDALDTAIDVSFGGVVDDPAWKAADNHVWALSLEGTDACGGGIATLPGNAAFQSQGVEDVVVPGDPGASAGIAVMLHEFGHNLGFGHADAGICRSSTRYDAPLDQWADQDEDPGSLCPYQEYGDWQDIMGFSEAGQRTHISALQRHLAGWLDGSTVTPGPGTTAVLLRPLDDLSGTRAVPVTDPRTGELYVVEYRTNAGGDATSQEFVSPLRDQELALRYLFPSLPGTEDTFARWAIDTPAETGGVRILRLLYGPNDTVRHDPAWPFFQESLVLAVGTSTFFPDAYNRNAHLDAGESFSSYSGGVRVDVDDLDSTAGAQIRVTTTRAPSSSTLVVTDRTLTTRQRPTLRIKVAAPTASAVTGTVVARVDGRTVRAVVLPGTLGATTITVPAITRPGPHTVSFSYRGSSSAVPSTSRAVRVSVRR